MTKNFSKHKRKLSIALAISLILGQVPVSVHGQENSEVIENTNVQTVTQEENKKEANNINGVKDSKIINIPDVNLKKAINKELGKISNSNITRPELEGITNLSLNRENISNIEGLQYCTNLEWLDLNFNNISDISPISKLTKLKSISFWDNNISDITPLSGLVNLRYVDLSENKIKDITPLSKLPQLVSVSLRKNDITSVKLEGLENLGLLELNDNKITNLYLKDLPVLEDGFGYLDISNNKNLKTVEMVNIPSIGTLDLSNRKITNITLEAMTGLSDVDLSNNNISDLSKIKLSDSKHLYNVNLNNNNITNINSLSNTSAKVLQLNDNNITNISGLNNFPNLGWLYLSNNKIVDISEISKLSKLTYLDIKNNKIKDINALSKLYNLWFLNISNNEISEVSSLSNLKKLSSIDLSDNKVSDITPLKNLPYNKDLGYIYLDRNYINLNDSKMMNVITTLKKKRFRVTYTGQKKTLNTFTTFTVNSINNKSTSVSGKGLKGATVKAYVNGKQIGKTATVSSNGTYKLTIPKQKANTKVVVKMSKSGYATTQKTITVLNTFTTFTVNSINNKSTNVSGKGLKGATVKAYVNGKQIGKTATVSSNGTYKLTIPKQKVNTKVVVKMSKSGYATTQKTITVLNTFATFTVNSINNKSTSVSGKGLKGATVKAYVNGKQIGKTVTVSFNGAYKLTIPKQKANTKVVVKMSKSGYSTTEKTITVKK